MLDLWAELLFRLTLSSYGEVLVLLLKLAQKYASLDFLRLYLVIDKL